MLKLKGEEEEKNVVNRSAIRNDDYETDDTWQENPTSYVERKDADDISMSGSVLDRDFVNPKDQGSVSNNNTVNHNTVEKEKKKDNPLLSVAVLVGFAAWIGALVYFSKTEPRLCISTFGAFWLLIAVVSVIGFIKDGIKDLRNVIVAFIFIYLGVGLTFVPILQLYVPRFQGQFGFRMAMYLVFIFCIVVGVLLAGIEAYRIIHSRAVCTVQVQAECLKLRDKHFWRDEVSVEEAQGYYRTRMGAGGISVAYRKKSVSGVYQFEYQGQTYEVQDDTNSAFDHPTPGKMYTLFINPKNPNEFYRRTPWTHAGVLFIGFSCLAVGILCCVLF